MKDYLCPILLTLFAAFFSSLNYADSDFSLSDAILASEPVSFKTLESRIKDAEAKTDLDEATKKRLIEVYRKTIRNLDEIRSNNAKTEAYIQSRKVDPVQAARIQKNLEQHKTMKSPVAADIFTVNTPFIVMERQLLAEKANLAAVKAKLSDLKQQLALSAARPGLIQQRLIEANQNQEDITARLLQGAVESRIPLLDEATRWMLETKLSSLRSEITMLDQELLSLPMRMEFLESGEAWYELSFERLSKRVAAIQEIVNQQRQIEAEKAKAEAEKAKRQLEGKPLLIQNLANENTALTDELSHLAIDLDAIDRASEVARRENERINDQFQGIRKKLEIGGFGRALGQVLIELRRQLPEADEFAKRAAFREQKVAEIGLKQLQYNEEYQELSSLPAYVEQLTAKMKEQEAEKSRNDLNRLAASRKALLDQLNKISTSYLRSLSDYEFIDQGLLSTINSYEKFLSQNLIWIRSSPLPNLAALQEMPASLDWLISPSLWSEVPLALANQAGRSPMLALGLLFFVILLWKSKSMRVSLRETGANIGKISKDRMSFTIHALVLTILLASSWPLLLALVGWQLSISIQATAFTNAISDILLSMSLAFFNFRFFWITCEPGGLAAAHFQIPLSMTKRMHREIGRLMLILLPSQFVFVLMYRYDLAVSTGEGGRILMAIILLAITAFIYRITPSGKMHFSNDSDRSRDVGLLSKLAVIRFILIAIPLGLIALDIIGYIFTVGLLAEKLVYTLFFIGGLFVIKKIAVRWLLLTQRRLAWHAALEKRAAAIAKREAHSVEKAVIESESGEVEEPEIDLAALSKESLYLLNVSLFLMGILGFLVIWAQILPAFSMLNEVTFWSRTGVVSGEEQLVPVTLLDLATALLIAFITYVVAKYLPSLLEIIMLQRTSLNPGSRYTVTTITNYMIVAIGTILFFNAIGADWSRLQWLIAALGVGIGFGLQEIVANFISGLIILFERPIRVGDIVSIGEHDGTVVRIRIRATTIRNWDRKELLVPNKEFITGRLMNWTLSETTTRIVIPVGLAYGGDVELAMKIMMEVAEDHPNVMSDPGPTVVFDEFGDNALSLKLRCFVPEIDYRPSTITALHKDINRRFNEAGLVIAFPQRDVHLDAIAPLDVFIRKEAEK